jgi:hypothetical protein
VALGAEITADRLNADLCALAQNRATEAWAALRLANYVDGIGIDGLEQAGFDSTEAGEYRNSVDVLKTDALIFLGQANQSAEYNYADALAAYIAPTTT